MFNLHSDLGDDVAVEEFYGAVGVAGVVLGVGYHDYGGAFFMEFGQKLHHLFSIL